MSKELLVLLTESKSIDSTYNMNKICTKCKRNLLITDFYKNKNSKYGVMSICKTCKKNYTSEFAKNKYKSDPLWREKRLKIISKWKKEHRYGYYRTQTDERRAQDKLKYAVKVNKIIKPEKCEYCWEIKKLDAHHYDYDKSLDIFWLCRQCHRDIHRRVKEFRSL